MGEAKEADRGINAEWWVADVGNSRIKSTIFKDGRQSAVLFYPNPLRVSSAPLLKPTGGNAAVASVNPQQLALWLKYLDWAGVRSRVVLESNGAVFKSGLVSTDVDTPETTGVDRVLGCLGACLLSPGRTVVVVDCGTATTVNAMTADRCFRGGVIMPGRMLLAKSLHQGTAALPEAVPDAVIVRIGKSTKECIESGVAACVIGGVRESVATMMKTYSDAAVFITGGDADIVASAFPEWRRTDHLTLHGLHWYAVNQSPAS
jgi:type III pantothenate kinase